jgi:hypothetical protein
MKPRIAANPNALIAHFLLASDANPTTQNKSVHSVAGGRLKADGSAIRWQRFKNVLPNSPSRPIHRRPRPDPTDRHFVLKLPHRNLQV